MIIGDGRKKAVKHKKPAYDVAEESPFKDAS